MAATTTSLWTPVAHTLTDPAVAEAMPLERFLARVRAGEASAEAAEFRWVARCDLPDRRIVHRYRHVAANRDLHLDSGGHAYRRRNRSGQLMLQPDRRRPATVYARLTELVGLDVPHSIVAGWSRRIPRRSGAA